MCCNGIHRRDFLAVTAAAAAGATLGTTGKAVAASAVWQESMWDPDRAFLSFSRPLRVQPVLMYRVAQRREMASWKSWGGVQSEAAADEEAGRVTSELTELAALADFPMKVLPVLRVRSTDEAASAKAADCDALVLYPATGSSDTLNACIPDKGAMIFVRHRSGPLYYWYEALSTRHLSKSSEGEDSKKRLSVNDVIVDDKQELQWRLRAWYASMNFLGARVVAIGGPQGKYAQDAPNLARSRFKLDIIDVSYADLGRRIESALSDHARVRTAERWTDRYLALPATILETDRRFVANAFILYGLFKEILQENGAHHITINQCMNTILPMSRTTACLALGLLNDEGYSAFCESDFVVVPAGIFLRYLSGKPVFMHNSTFPHNAVVTCAHCTSPRRMNSKEYEPVRLLTHYESEYGAAPKVEMPKGQEVTFIDPEYAKGRWVGIKGVVEANPFYEICRSQQDVRILGNWKRLLDEVRDSHWMMVYGDYLKEIGYAAPRMGVVWDCISEA
jgi:L-fucose isomerase-like protein